MKFLNYILISFSISFSCFSQTNIETLQGVWEIDIEGNYRSFVVIEENIWYSIVSRNHEISVSKDLFGFYDNVDIDRLSPWNLFDSGRYLFILLQDYVELLNPSSPEFPVGYYMHFSYDLDGDYFVYYANQPVSLNRIDSLPSNISIIFEKKKKELSEIVYPDIGSK